MAAVRQLSQPHPPAGPGGLSFGVPRNKRVFGVSLAGPGGTSRTILHANMVSLKLLADFRQRDNDVPPGFTVMQRGKKPSKASLKKDFIVSSTHQRVQSQDDRYAFTAEWYDPNASLFRRYELLYYPKDGSVEMYDVKNHRTFLKRTKYESLHLEDLFVGNKITVFSRHLSLVDYGDQYTARKLGSRKEKTLALIKPDATPKIGELVDIIINAGFTITKAKMMMLSRKEAVDFYVDHQSKPFYNELLHFITSGPVVAMEILGDEAVCKWKALLGPANSAVAKTDEPDSIRANFGHDGIRNAAHGPDSVASAAQELELFFPSSGGRGPVNSAKFTNCTCCIIKPHAVNEGMAGKIIKAITDEGFQISALQMFNMERANVEEFYEIYKGVVAEYMEMVTELCSGPCIAMEIMQPEPPKTFREFCGPSDPEIARHLRPGTLRAVFGKNKIQNAVHCTDLPEDGLLEVQYFFKILDN